MIADGVVTPRSKRPPPAACIVAVSVLSPALNASVGARSSCALFTTNTETVSCCPGVCTLIRAGVATSEILLTVIDLRVLNASPPNFAGMTLTVNSLCPIALRVNARYTGRRAPNVNALPLNESCVHSSSVTLTGPQVCGSTSRHSKLSFCLILLNTSPSIWPSITPFAFTKKSNVLPTVEAVRNAPTPIINASSVGPDRFIPLLAAYTCAFCHFNSLPCTSS